MIEANEVKRNTKYIKDDEKKDDKGEDSSWSLGMTGNKIAALRSQ